MRAISCSVSVGKVCSRRGNALASRALPSAPVPVAGVTAISVSPYRKVAKPAAGPTRLFARFFSAAIMWCGGLIMGRCRRDVVSSPRLRFSPLEVFAQRLLQPIPSCIFFRQMACPAFALFPVIRHHGPAFMRRAQRQYHRTLDGRKPGAGRTADEFGDRIGPELAERRQWQANRADFAGLSSSGGPFARLRERGPCGKDRPACRGRFGQFS